VIDGLNDLKRSKMKKETLEEAAKKLFSTMPSQISTTTAKKKALELAKWQQERSYSKEEVLEHLNHLIMIPSSELDKFTDDKEMITMKWFEQFKKK
jgi:hypothetical protein